MTSLIRFIVGAATLLPAGFLVARDADTASGPARVAVVVDMTSEGRKVAHPTPDKPAYYLPVVIGYKELGDFLRYYQRPPPPAEEVQNLLSRALADQNYRVATRQSPPSLVLVYRWGYISPETSVSVRMDNDTHQEVRVPTITNRDEMMTYLVGDQWQDPTSASNPANREIISDVNTALSTLDPNVHAGARYFLLVSALDFKAFQQHKSVLLWRAHVSMDYWGRYLDETLPTLIAAGAPRFGRETLHPRIITAPAIPMGHVIVGTPMLVRNDAGASGGPNSTVANRLQADTDKALAEFAERAEDGMVQPSQVTMHLDLAATDNARNAAPEAPRGTSANGAIHRLPPYIVTNTPVIQWLYGAIPGFEILSSCSGHETEDFTRDIYRQQVLLNAIAPPNLQMADTVPTTVILFRDDLKKWMSGKVADLVRANATRFGVSLAEAGVTSAPADSELLPQVTLWDEDSIGLEEALPGGSYKIQFDPDYVFCVLAKRTPPLPAWFTVGVVNLYQTRSASIAQPDAFSNFSGPRDPYSTVQNFSPAFWISPEVTKIARSYPTLWVATEAAGVSSDEPATHQARLSMRELLTEPPPREGTDDEKRSWLSKFGLLTPGAPSARQSYAQAYFIVRHGADKNSPWRHDVWRSQSMLFVRWALDDDSHVRSKALWKFAARASVEPPTEAMFRECFGVGFDEAGAQLDGYLPDAIRAGFYLAPETPVEIPRVKVKFLDPALDSHEIELREANDAEEARLLGDWERKEIDFVRRSYPEYADKYANQAGLTLMRAYDDGLRDPGLLAAVGLYECATGDDGRARGILEAAVRARVARPQAYVELARIRLAAALAKPAGKEGKLDRDQVASALDLLQATRSLQPPQLKAFLLAAGAWEHADFIPTPAELRMLEEGLGFFPYNSQLVLAAAQLDAAAGLRVDAIRVLDGGLRNISSPRMRALFQMLRTRYATGVGN